MRFLLDQDVYSLTRCFLTSLGHDIITVAQMGYAQTDDSELLKIAQAQNRIFITRDRDFGSLVFIESLGAGVIYLRILPSTQNSVHNELERVLKSYPEKELKHAFVVIEPGRHRFRRLDVI